MVHYLLDCTLTTNEIVLLSTDRASACNTVLCRLASRCLLSHLSRPGRPKVPIKHSSGGICIDRAVLLGNDRISRRGKECKGNHYSKARWSEDMVVVHPNNPGSTNEFSINKGHEGSLHALCMDHTGITASFKVFPQHICRHMPFASLQSGTKVCHKVNFVGLLLMEEFPHLCNLEVTHARM